MNKNKENELIGKGFQKILDDFFINKEEKSILINNVLYKFNEILSVDLKENEISRTISAGIGKSHKKFSTIMGTGVTKPLVNRLDIEIKTNRMDYPFVVIKVLKLGIRIGFDRNSKKYREAYNQAQHCLSIMQLIISENEKLLKE